MNNIQALFFPYMHPEFMEKSVPEWVLFLDPGIAGARGYNSLFFHPDNLRITEKDALKYVQSCLNFGEQFRDPKEISYLLGEDLEEFNKETPTQIKSLLKRSKDYSDIYEVDNDNEDILKAQMALLLAWTLEERLLEYSDLQQGVNDQWKNLLEDLGVEGEEGLYLPGIENSSQNEILFLHRELDWLKILPWFLVFTQSLSLFVVDSEIKEQWEEQGLVFEQFSTQYPGLYHTYAYGYELILQSKESEKWHWLNEKYHVLFQF